MLQRAASNAYSWWWASNIRTKQSKWLDNSLQEMEEKVKSMIKLIEEDADTFARKAEMYFQRRPILINFVEEAYREYKALADRYDHLSGELHKANHTIATAFPDQIQLAMQDDDDGDGSPKVTSFDPSKLLKPSAVLQRISTLNKYRENRSTTRKPKPRCPVSAIDKDKACEEVDRLQKEILVLQTKREFVKSTYESSLAKFLEIEKQMTDMQDEVSYLQEEFSVTVEIEDDEARAVMAAAALKSCEETLISLQEQQIKVLEEARVESQRIKEAKIKLKALKIEYDQSVPETPENESDVSSTTMEDEVCSLKQERLELNSVCERVKEHFERNSDSSVAELAEKIDELVEKIINLELTVSSQNAQITRLRLENDELQKHMYAFEEDKGVLADDSSALNRRLELVEDQLQRILDLEIFVHNDKGVIHANLKKAFNSLHDISDKLQSPTHQTDINAATPPLEEKDEKTQSSQDKLVEGRDHVDSETASHIPTDPDELQKLIQGLGVGKSNSQTEIQKHGDSSESQQTLPAEADGKDKILLDVYKSMLRDYRETKEKLSEVEKKNHDSLYEMVAQITDLKSDNAKKEEELHTLRQKLVCPKSPKPDNEDSSTSKLAKYRKHRSRSLYSIMTEDRYRESKKLDATYFVGNESPEEDIKLAPIEEYTPSGIEEKFRTDIDNLLEENLDFWLRFCTSYHQIQKFKTRFQAIQAEVEKLKDGKKQESNTTGAGEDGTEKGSTPTDKKLRELNTELQVWLEQNGLLKVEIKKRSSSLGAIQDEIIKVLKDCQNVGVEFTPYQAAKYQGEVTNMQYENKKVASELKTGIDHVKGLQAEVGKLLSTLHKSLELPSPKKNHQNQPIKHTSSKGRVPLRTFLFGTKPKKPSIFSCMSPAVRKHYNNIKHGMPS